MEIIHGDCLEELKKLPSCSAHLLCTDPPYGDNIAYGLTKRTIVGNEDPLLGLLALRLCYRILKPNSTAYFFLGTKHLPFIDDYIVRYSPYRLRDVLVWDKERFGLGYAFRKQYELIAVLDKGNPHYFDFKTANVLRFKRENTELHPHLKPLELIKTLILHSTARGDTVLDPFAGTGTTAVAAKVLGREYVAIEKEEKYVAIGNTRLRGVMPLLSLAS